MEPPGDMSADETLTAVWWMITKRSGSVPGLAYVDFTLRGYTDDEKDTLDLYGETGFQLTLTKGKHGQVEKLHIEDVGGLRRHLVARRDNMMGDGAGREDIEPFLCTLAIQRVHEWELGFRGCAETESLANVRCGCCGKNATDAVPQMICSACHSIYYCSEACQSKDYRTHKHICDLRAESADVTETNPRDIALVLSGLRADDDLGVNRTATGEEVGPRRFTYR